MIHLWEDMISGLVLNPIMGGLHCGDCFDVKVRDVWIPVRIEMDEDWYLVGLSKTRLGGLTVRM